MSRWIKYIWDAQDPYAICKQQIVADGGAFVFDGNMVDPITGQVNFRQRGYCRNIGINSNDDATAILFTITGTQNGVTIQESFNGGNNNVSYSQYFYDTVNSITISGGAVNDNIWIGTGLRGAFNMIASDEHIKSLLSNYGVQIYWNTNLGYDCQYNINHTLDKVQNNGLIIQDLINKQNFITLTGDTNFQTVYNAFDYMTMLVCTIDCEITNTPNSVIKFIYKEH